MQQKKLLLAASEKEETVFFVSRGCAEKETRSEESARGAQQTSQVKSLLLRLAVLLIRQMPPRDAPLLSPRTILRSAALLKSSGI